MIKKTIFTFAAGFMAIGLAEAQMSITTNGVAVGENFNSMGTSGTASLPTGWRIGASATTAYSAGTTVVTQAAGTSGTGALTGTSGGGAYNFASGVTATSTDRALGLLSSSSYTSPKSIMVEIENNTGTTIKKFDLSWDYEKYRTGSRAFDWTFSFSTDGINFTNYVPGAQSYAADASNAVVNPPTTISKSFSFYSASVFTGDSIYFKWTYTGNGGSTNGQGLALDNFSVVSSVPEPSQIGIGMAALLGGVILMHRRSQTARNRF